MYFVQVWLDFVKKNPALSLMSLIILLTIPVNDVALPHLYSKFIESLQKNDMNNSKKIAIILVCLMIFIQSMSVLGDVKDSTLIPKFQGHLSLEMVKKILDKYDKEYTDISTGSLLARFAKVPEIVLYWISSIKDYCIPYILTFFGIFVYFFYYDKLIGTFFFFTLFSILLIINNGFKNCKSITNNSANAESSLFNEIEDILNNVLSIFSNNKKAEELERLKNVRTNYENLYRKSVMCSLKIKLSCFTLLTVFFIFFVYRCIYLVKNKKLETPRIIAMFMMFTTVLTSIIWCINITREMIKDYGIALETDGFINDNKTIEFILLPQSPPYQTGIGLYKVDFTYPNTDKQILYDISFRIDRGERVVITGDNGMGKSTVLKILMGFYRPTNGSCYVDGKWYDQYKKEELRKKIGYIPQNSVLFNRSIMENIRYGNENYSEEDIRKYIDNLDVKIDLGDLNRKAGKAGNNVSGGQRQLIWMLRILLKNPEYIILDEPTNNLDQNTKEVLIALLNKVSKEQTIIAISHDKFLVDYFNRKIVIDKGKLVQ